MATATKGRVKGAPRRVPATPEPPKVEDATPPVPPEADVTPEPEDGEFPFATEEDLPDPSRNKKSSPAFKVIPLPRLQRRVRVHFIDTMAMVRLEYLPDVLRVQDLVEKARAKLSEHIDKAKKAEEEGRVYIPDPTDPKEERETVQANVDYMQTIAHASVMADDALRADGHIVFIECRDCDPDEPVRHVKPLWSRARCRTLQIAEARQISDTAFRVPELDAIRPFLPETEERSSPTPVANSESTP